MKTGSRKKSLIKAREEMAQEEFDMRQLYNMKNTALPLVEGRIIQYMVEPLFIYLKKNYKKAGLLDSLDG